MTLEVSDSSKAQEALDIDKCLPLEIGADLNDEQVKVERAAIKRYGLLYTRILYACIALVAAVPAIQNLIDPPYFWRGTLLASLYLSVITLGLAAYGHHLVEMKENELDAQRKRTKRMLLVRIETYSIMMFFVSFTLLTTFVGANALEVLRNDYSKIDIVASKYVVQPGQVVLLSADAEGADTFEWYADSGRLLDNNEESIAWISDIEFEGPEHTTTIVVRVRRNHLYYEEEMQILTLGDAASEAREIKTSTHLQEFFSQRSETEIPAPLPPLLPCSAMPLLERLFGQRNCISD